MVVGFLFLCQPCDDCFLDVDPVLREIEVNNVLHVELVMTGPIASSWEYNLKGFPSERGESTPRASSFLGNEDIELLGRSISGS